MTVSTGQPNPARGTLQVGKTLHYGHAKQLSSSPTWCVSSGVHFIAIRVKYRQVLGKLTAQSIVIAIYKLPRSQYIRIHNQIYDFLKLQTDLA